MCFSEPATVSNSERLKPPSSVGVTADLASHSARSAKSTTNLTRPIRLAHFTRFARPSLKMHLTSHIRLVGKKGIAMPNESVQSDKALKAADTVIFVYSLLNRESWLQAKLAVSELPSSIRNIVFAGNFYDAIRNGSRTCNFSAELEIFVNEKNAMGTLPKFSFLSVSAKNGENIVALLNLSII